MTKQLLEFLQIITELSEKYKNIAIETNNSVNLIKKEILDFEVCVPFIGEFSVGKSALLNIWLGEEILPEDQLPTTALATELRWADSTKMYIISDDGARHHISALPKTAEEANQFLNTSSTDDFNAAYALCNSNSANLRKINPIVPVDMPGTNSGIKRHTEALYRYVNKGIAFFIVVAADQGTIPASLLAFLDELHLNNTPVFIVLNKCDLKTPEDTQAMANELVNQCRTIGCYPEKILFTSRFNEDTSELVHNALASLDTDELCVNHYVPKLINLCERLKSVIQTLNDCSTMDTVDLERQIKDHVNMIKFLESALHKEESKLDKTLKAVPELVASDVYSELLKNVDTLVHSAIINQEALVTRITGIVNRVYSSSLQRYFSIRFEKVLHNLEVSLHEESSHNTISLETISETLLKAPVFLDKLNNIFTSFVPGEGKKSTTAAGIYRVIATTFAITSAIINPIIELVLVFLPDIVKFFSNPEEEKRMQIQQQLESVVFRDVRNQIEENIRTEIPEIVQNMLSLIRNEWNGKIEENRQAIAFIQQKITTQENTWQEMQIQYNTDIAKLDELINSFNSMTTKEPSNV